jgi:hypothetical protein
MMVKEKKEYYTIAEAAAEINKSRASLYIYMKRLGIEPRPFEEIDKKRVYLSAAQVERIKIAEGGTPWKAGLKPGK